MNRRRWLAILLGIVPWAFLHQPREAWAETNDLDPELIKAGLRTAAPEEHGFVDYVVGLANRGVIDPRIVQSAFLWARRKPDRRFQYFKRAVILLAARRGIRL